MNRISQSFWLLLALALGGSNPVLSEDLPSTQPKLLTIVREEVKVGRTAEHAKHEAGWPAAFEKARNSAVTRAQMVWMPMSPSPVSQQPLR